MASKEEIRAGHRAGRAALTPTGLTNAGAGIARHGLAWWQIDTSYYIIRLMELVGLAWRVRVPTPDVLEAKRAR